MDLKWTDGPFELKPVSNFAKSKHAPTTAPSNAHVKHDYKAKLIGKRINVKKCNSTYSMYYVKWLHFKACHKAYYPNVTFVCAWSNHCTKFA